MPGSGAIVVEHLYKVFGRHPKHAIHLLRDGLDKASLFEKTRMTVAVEDASLDIGEGETFVVMGLSGSGKSTLLRMLNRLIEPSAGRVLVGGRDISNLSTKDLIEVRRTKMSMVFQSFALMPHLSVWQNVAFGLKVAGRSSTDEQHARALDVLEKVGLREHAHSRPSELSGGMQQRVGLARALAVDPDVMLMDEAFSALDPLIRAEMQDELIRLQADRKRTIVFISHDLDEAMRIGDRIAIMESGRVVQVGTPDEILNHPANDFVRSFFRGVDVGNIYRAGDIVRKNPLTIVDRHPDGVRVALEQLREQARDFGYVEDKTGRFVGVVSADSLLARAEQGKRDLAGALIDVVTLDEDTDLSTVVRELARSRCPLPVTNAGGRLVGIVSKTALLETMEKAT